MNITFFDPSDLSYKDHGYIGHDFDVILDSAVTQKSIFTVNAETLNADYGDVVLIREGGFVFLGTVSSIEAKEKGKLQVSCQDYRESLNVPVNPKDYSGNVCAFLASHITEQFISTSDSLQKRPYLIVDVVGSVNAKLKYEGDTIATISDIASDLNKRFGVTVACTPTFSLGEFTGITIEIETKTDPLRIRHDWKALESLCVRESSAHAECNKVAFYPRSDNSVYLGTYCFYLQTDGTVTADRTSPKRYRSVVMKAETYSDSDFPNLTEKAQSAMTISQDDLQITFAVSRGCETFPTGLLALGVPVIFYGKTRTYEASVTQLRYKNTLGTIQVTLGELRTSLTDLIKQMNGDGIERSGGLLSATKY